MTHKPIDFVKVEELRKHMLIPTGDWAKLLGSSRMAYYKWVMGTARPRIRREDGLRLTIKRLLAVLSAGWPQPEIAGLDPRDRAAKLLELLNQQQ